MNVYACNSEGSYKYISRHFHADLRGLIRHDSGRCPVREFYAGNWHGKVSPPPPPIALAGPRKRPIERFSRHHFPLTDNFSGCKLTSWNQHLTESPWVVRCPKNRPAAWNIQIAINLCGKQKVHWKLICSYICNRCDQNLWRIAKTHPPFHPLNDIQRKSVA